MNNNAESQKTEAETGLEHLLHHLFDVLNRLLFSYGV